MKAKVICKAAGKGQQNFFVVVAGKEYYLFRQDYRASNQDFFKNGVSIDSIGNYDGVHSQAVRKTLDKLPTYLRYIEKEYGIAIYERGAQKTAKKQKPYKRKTFCWRQQVWDTV